MDSEPSDFGLPQRILPDRDHALWNASELQGWTHALNAQKSASQMGWLEQAGHVLANLTLALHPHSRHIWLCCGPGRNGLDGWHAARSLVARGKLVSITSIGSPPHEMADLQGLLTASPPDTFDLTVDALFGIGLSRPITPSEVAGQLITRMHASNRPMVHMDLPSGLCPSTGRWLGPDLSASLAQKDTLAMLGMSVGLWTSDGRDHAGQVWLSTCNAVEGPPPSARLFGEPPYLDRPLNSHKGSFGHVMVLGGNSGMRGAGLLAARSALTHGAGIVHWWAPDGKASQCALDFPLAPIQTLDRWPNAFRARDVVVAGCGAGVLPETVWHEVLTRAPSLVLDADGLNAVSASPSLRRSLLIRHSRQLATVITPHPLEAARLLSCETQDVQDDRLKAAKSLSHDLGCVTLLKGSGTVVSEPNGTCWINPAGNARLATAGSGDVLAGCVGAFMAQGLTPIQAAKRAAHVLGQLAESTNAIDCPLTADRQALGQRG